MAELFLVRPQHDPYHSEGNMKTKPRIFVSVPDDRHLDDRRKALKRAIIRFIAEQQFDVVGLAPEHLPVLILFEENMDRAGIFGSGIKPTAIPADADQKWIGSESFRMHFDAWAMKVRERRDVFLGYCSKANSSAKEIRDYLESKGFSVLDWSRDFKPAGATILEEIE